MDPRIGLDWLRGLGRYPPQAYISPRPQTRLRPTAVQAYRSVQARSSNTPSWIQVSEYNFQAPANERALSDRYFDALCSQPQRFLVKQFELVSGEWRVIRECNNQAR